MGEINIKADINYQKVKEGELFPKNRIVHRSPEGKRCEQVSSTVLEGSGKRILFHTTERVYVDEDGRLIASGDVKDWLVEDDGKETQVEKFEQNMKKGAGIFADNRTPRENLRGFVVGDIYEIITEDENQLWNLWQLAKDLWDKKEIGIIKEVILASGYNVRVGLLVPHVDYDSGTFYVELQTTTKKREPAGMKIPGSPPTPGAPVKEDEKRKHVQSLVNPMEQLTYNQLKNIWDNASLEDKIDDLEIEFGDSISDEIRGYAYKNWDEIPSNIQSKLNSDTILYLRRNPSDPDELKDNMEYTITEAEPWVDGTWVKPGKYPVIDTRVKEGYITIVADTYDDKVGTLLHAVDQQVIVNTNKDKLQEEIFEGQYVDAHVNPLKPISEERINWEEKVKYIIGSEWDMDGSDVDGLLMVSYREKLLDDAWNNKQSAEDTAEKIMSIENPGEGDTVDTGYDWDDYVEDIVTRYDAGQYKEAFDLYREYCRGKSPEDIARFYKALEERDVDYQTLLRKGRLNPGIPTKEFWDKIYPKIFKRYKKKYRSKSKAEEIARQVVGSIWYHKMGRDAKDRYERVRKYREARTNPEKTYDYDEHDNGWGWKCPVCEDEYGLLPQHYTFKTQDEAYQDVLKHLLTEHPEDIKDIENEYGPKLKSMTTGAISLFVPMFGRRDPNNYSKDWTW